MRHTNIIFVLLVLLFENCNSANQLSGRYANSYSEVSGEEIIFNQPNRFEYYLKTEMGILEYSAGSWQQNKDKVMLKGFTRENIKVLYAESRITNNVDSMGRIVVQYVSKSNVIKVDIVLNDAEIFHISSDTTLLPSRRIKNIQVKSYLSHAGLLSSPPKIDTLRSSVISVDGESNLSKNVSLKFNINLYDFVRVVLHDTITIKCNHTILYPNKIKFRKS